jgi:transcriptional regulator with XRE-family HTH domain
MSQADNNDLAFGAYVKHLIQTRGTSQRALAREMQTDSAHLSRILSGQRAPKRRTIEKIADALAASPDERQRLFEVSGYTAPTRQTTMDDYLRVANAVRDPWLVRRLPIALVVDTFFRVWGANDAFVKLFTKRSAEDVAGKNLLDLWFDAEFGLYPALGRVMTPEQIETFILTGIARFQRFHARDVREDWHRTVVHNLRRFPTFAAHWEAATARQHALIGHVSLIWPVDLRDGGRLILHVAPIRLDRRFNLILMLPIDARSAHMIEEFV